MFCVLGLLSFTIMRFIQVVAYISSSFLFIAELYTILCTIISQFVCPYPIDGHWGCFQILAIMKKSAMNILAQEF